MRNQIENASSLVHKRKKGPVSALDIWRFEKIRKKDHSILEPLLCGMSNELQEVFSRTYPALEAACLQPRDADVPPLPQDADASSQPVNVGVPPQPSDAGSSGGIPFSEMEIEHPRFEGQFEMPDFGPSPSRREELTLSSARDLESDSQIRKFLGIEMLPTPELSVYAGTADPESENPGVSQERLPVEVTSFPEIPEILRSAEPVTPYQGEQLVGETSVPLDVLHSAETEELNFLEAENSTIHEGPAENDFDTLSVRTRAVAQYFQRQTPMSLVSEGPSGQMSLNKILEGKTRKQCARMFFETLVLKTYGFMDVQQEEAYGDITLTLTPNLSKAHF